MAKHAVRRGSGRHRARTRPRYGRIGAVAAAVTVTAVAVAGGFGLLPTSGGPAAAGSSGAGSSSAGSSGAGSSATGSPAADRPAGEDTPDPEKALALDGPVNGELADAGTPIAAESGSTELPAASGTGRRVVFSEERQRVWLVDGAGSVERTYLVSGSVYDNLEPGTYAVYSRSRNAIGIDDSGTMEYFVRFTQGTQGAAIGFHTIPVDEGEPVQTIAQLGTPLSHGCIRQARPNAIAMWEFAPIGTKVVVTV
ncbi:L,D-transpeptidase [Nocardioides carbamazepini]|uniref:L,D-transpeptidase n=1 Tax=Nocardioides carbamazepini TaxID=2854259 RepID=UPI00214A7B36|nr:L,D-transpeptidase [Nocardioides carbamazepini]MCR1782027.1 L,D-transpeptidase [Nocardioides carbamazepini]